MFDQAVQLVRPGGVIVYSTLVDMPNMEVIELYSCMSIFYYWTELSVSFLSLDVQ